MASLKIILRKSKINSAGEAPLCIRLIKNRKAQFIFLDTRIKPEHWDDKERRVKKSHPNSGRLNNDIAQKLAKVQAQTLDVEADNINATSGAIKQAIKGRAAVPFFPYADRFANSFEAAGKIGSYGRAKTVIQKLKDYVNERKITFQDITVSFLKEYEYHMQSALKNRVNTIHANMRVFRTIFNNAAREDLIPAEINPFHKMKLKTEPTQRAYLTEEELNKIDELVITESLMMNHHRNIYVFASYVGGLRISDVLQLRWKNFDGEKIIIKIQKTQATLAIKLPERGLQILDLYKRENCNANEFIFPLLKVSPDATCPKVILKAITSATTYTNKDLRKLAELAGIDKHLSFHTSRHTWATRALTKGMRIEHVSKLMGHANIKETQIYAKIVSSELDNAMAVFN